MNPCASLCRDDRVGQSFPPFLPSFCFNKSSLLLRLIYSFVSTKSPSPRLNHAEPSLESRRALVCFPPSPRLFFTEPSPFFHFPNRVLVGPHSRSFPSPIAPFPFPNGLANRSLRFTARTPFAVPRVFFLFSPSPII